MKVGPSPERALSIARTAAAHKDRHPAEIDKALRRAAGHDQRTGALAEASIRPEPAPSASARLTSRG